MCVCVNICVLLLGMKSIIPSMSAIVCALGLYINVTTTASATFVCGVVAFVVVKIAVKAADVYQSLLARQVSVYFSKQGRKLAMSQCIFDLPFVGYFRKRSSITYPPSKKKNNLHGQKKW